MWGGDITALCVYIIEVSRQDEGTHRPSKALMKVERYITSILKERAIPYPLTLPVRITWYILGMEVGSLGSDLGTERSEELNRMPRCKHKFVVQVRICFLQRTNSSNRSRSATRWLLISAEVFA